MNEAFITNIFEGTVFTDENDSSVSIDWDGHSKDGNQKLLDTDFYRLRLDTFYTFDPSINSTHSGRLYEQTAYISEIDQRTAFLVPQEGIFGYTDIKNFSYNVEDYNGEVGLEIEAHSPTRDKSSVLDVKLTAEWWHLESTKESAVYLGMQKDITDNLYQSKPVISFSEETIRPMEIYSKAHMVSGSEDGSSRLQTYSGWDKVAGVWFDEDSNIQYSGKDGIGRSAIDNTVSYEQYEIPDSGYQHYENELYTKYRIVYSGEEANKYKDARQVTFTRQASESVSVERRATRASYSDSFFDDWETISENASSPFLDSEELFDYISEEMPVETENVYEVVPYTGNISLGEDYAEIDIIPNVGWDSSRSDYLPLCLKEDELFFRDGCNVKIRQEGMLENVTYNKYSEAKVYFQDTNTIPLSGYKVEFEVVPPDESRILQLQSVEEGLNDGDSVYFLGLAKGGDSVGEAVWDEEHYGKLPTDSEAELGISPSTAVESSRKITSSTDYGITKNIDRGSPIVPRVVPEEEYSVHSSGQKYIAYPHGAYPGYHASRNYSTAGDLYTNFGERSFFDIRSRSLYEQKINQEDKVYFKDEREVRIFESGICDGSASIDLTLESKNYKYEVSDVKKDIEIKRENGTELGIRDGVISCEPEGDEQNYFFSTSNAGPTDIFRGNGRLNYFMTKDYVLNSYGNVLEIEAFPNEKVSLDLAEDLFNDGEIYYVERDIYVARDEGSQANYLEPEDTEYSGEELHYLTQTYHEIVEGSIPDESPLNSPDYFNQQRKFIEELKDTDIVSSAIVVTEGTSHLTVPELGGKVGVMIQKAESEYFPDKDGTYSSELSPGIYTVSFSGLTLGSYYELQIKKVIDSEIVWETVEKGANKKAKETGLSFSNIDDGTYRLQEWVKLVSYGSVPKRIEKDLGVLDSKTKYRLVDLDYSVSLKQEERNWIINKNTFVNSNIIHDKALSVSDKEIGEQEGFISTVVPGDNYFSHYTPDIDTNLEKDFISSSVFSLPNNPHILRNMEGSPFKSVSALRTKLKSDMGKPDYQFNGELLPYYIEARGNIATDTGGSGARVKGGAVIDKKEGEYNYDSFSRLRITKYVYKIYKKNAVLLGDLANRNGERDYGGWDFELDKSVKDDSGGWGDWQSANVISTDKIRSNYYPAGTVYNGVAIPRSLYFKDFGLPESDDSGSFDDGHTIDAVMLTTDETKKYEPTEIRFRIKKKQIVETDSECKVLSKYNFLPLSLSWDFLKGAKNLAAGLTGGGPYEIELTDSNTNSYAIKKAENEEVTLLNNEEELAIYGLVEDEKSGLLRRGKVSDFKVGEPVKISNIPQDADGKVKLKIVSSGSGDVLTEILKLPSSYTIKQNAKVNDEIKTTHERMVQGHEANLINIGGCGDEIYNVAADFECMSEDSGPLVNYEVVASGFGADDDTTVTLGGNDVGTGYQNDFYNPPFQTSNFTISGDNAGVFVCSGSAEIEVTVDTDKDFHVINVNKVGDSDVTVNFDTPLTLAPQEGANQDGQTKDVTVLGEATYDNDEEYIVLSDYSRIPDQHNFDDSSHTFKLIEDENIYLEQSDNDKQIVFDCLSKINLPSSPTTFSFTGVNIATESIPIVSPNNHLINGELVHYLKPRSESKISYASNAFSVETISELETTIAQENIDKTKLLTSSRVALNSSSLTSGQIFTTDKRKVDITLASDIPDNFEYAIVIKSSNPKGNVINITEAKEGQNQSDYNVEGFNNQPGVIINRKENGERKFTSITKNFPRATLGTKAGDSNFSMASDAALKDWIVPDTSSVNFSKRINHIELGSSSPATTEINVPALTKGHHIYITNTSGESKNIEFYNDDNAILSHFLETGNDLYGTSVSIGKEKLVRIKFIEGKNQYKVMEFSVHKNTSDWSYYNNPTHSTMVLPDLKTLAVPFSDSIVAKSSLIKVTWHEDWGLTSYGEEYIQNLYSQEKVIYYTPEGGEFYSESEEDWLEDTGNYTRENTTDPRGWTGIAVEKTSVSLNKDEEIVFYVADGWEDEGTGVFTLSEDAEKGATILYGNLAGFALEPFLHHTGKRVATTYDGSYYRSIDEIATKGVGSHRLIIPKECFSNGGLTLIGGLTVADDFKVIVLPNDAPKGGTYHLDYSKFTDVGDKIFVVPLYNQLPAEVIHRYTSTVTHQGQQFYWPEAWDNEGSGVYVLASDGNPYFEAEEDENENVISVEISTTRVLAFERKNENGEDGIHISMLVSEVESSEDDSGPIEDENVRVVKAGEKIIRIASEEVKTIDLNTRIAGSDHSEILIINETLVETSVEIITKLGGLTPPILLDKRSAAKFTYNTAGPKYEKSDVQFYEVVYYSEYPERWGGNANLGRERPLLKTNKFYDKSDYDEKVLLFNTSVKVEGAASTASKWIDGEKYRCNMVDVEDNVVTPLYNQIKYAYNSDSLDLDRYYILDTPLNVNTPITTSGLVINKSNKEIIMGSRSSTGVGGVEIYEGDVDDRGADHEYANVELLNNSVYNENPEPSGAKATVTVKGGKVVKVEITAAGARYEVGDWLYIEKGDIGDGEYNCFLEVTSLSTKTAATLYSDEAWSNGNYLRSLNLRSEDFFIRLSNHTFVPRYNLGTKVTLEEELKFNQEEVTNFCRINKLSPKANNDGTWEWDKWGNLVEIDNEQGEYSPDGGLYKYGIKLYGNQLNSSKKIDFEFDYDNYYTTNDKQAENSSPEVYDDLIHGKKVPSRALAGAIGFSINTGHESIVKCVSFNERTSEITFSGIEVGKKHLVATQGYIPLTNNYIFDKLPTTIIHPVIKYNGKEYKNGEEFIGELGHSTYTIKSLDYANVKLSLLSNFVDQINDNLPADVRKDLDQIQTVNQVVNPPEAESESAWVKMPSDTKTITINGDYEDGSTYITVGSGDWTSSATPAESPVVGEVFLFGTKARFEINFIVVAPFDEALTLYGNLRGGNLYSGDVGKINLSKEIKDSQEWGTVIKNTELLSGYRWSNFQVYHASNYKKVRELLTDDDLVISTDEDRDIIDFSKRKDQWHFIIIKLTSNGETKNTLADYSYDITSDLIKIKEGEGEIYVLHREYKDDPPFNRYSKIKGITLTEPAHDDGIERVKIGKSEAFIPNDNYTIISTDNQAFKDELSVSDSNRAEASKKSGGDPITAAASLEERNVDEEKVALNPTKNYANEVGWPAEKTFYTDDALKSSDKIRVRLSRLIGKRVVLRDYANNERIKNLESLNIKHQLKYILEGELRSAYAYDEQACKGTVSLGSALLSPTGSNNNIMIVEDSLLKSGDAIIFETVEGSAVTLETYKVYFVKSIDLNDGPTKFYLFRAKKLSLNFKETFTGLGTGSKFRIVSETDSLSKVPLVIKEGGEGSNEGESGSDDVAEPAESFCCLDSNEYVIINETCFKINPAFQNDEKKIEGGVLGLELESYSFEYSEKDPPDENGEIYPLSVSNDNILDIFDSRNNFVKNFYVIKYHKDDKKTVVLHLTKGRTYRYFIKSNVDAITHGPSDTISLNDDIKGTFEAKQEKVEIVFGSEVEIKNLSSYICILEELKYEETDKALVFKPHSSSPWGEVEDNGFHSMLKGQGRAVYDTGLEDIFLDWNEGKIYDKILPAEINKIYPHEKEITGGNVELSWIISEEYWGGFWFNTINYSPKYYTCIIYKNNEEITRITVENYLYPKMLAEGGFLKLDDKELISSESINYDKELLRYMIEGKGRKGEILEYKAGTNEDYLLYKNKKYVGSASISYVDGENIELVAKTPEIKRPSFTTTKDAGDTFHVEIIDEALFLTSKGFNEKVELSQISEPLRLPLSWVSTFSASDVQNTQKFKDDKYDIAKVKLEIFGNADSKGIVLPDSLLQVNVPLYENGNPKRFSVISRSKVSGCLDFFRNIFYHISFSKAKVCIYDPIIEGRVSNVRILDNGKNYLSEPTVTFDSPPEGYQINDGTGKMIDFTRQAEGIAKLDTEGKISRIEVTTSGAGYGWKPAYAKGGYPSEKSTDVHPSAYTLLKIKSGDIVPEILGTNHFIGQKFFSYNYQLANATSQKVDPVSITIKANPDDSVSNVVSMGVSSEELDAISEQQFRVKEMSVDDIEAKSYLASEMSEKVLICGSSKLSGTSIPDGGHQDDFTISSEDNPQDVGLIQVTPDDDGAGAEDGEDEIVSDVPLGTSELDNREADVTISESLAKALGIVSITSLVDYRTIREPERNPYPWLSGMSSSTRPDFPMFFGTAPGTEISADAFNNLVDAANSLNKVSIDLPVYVRITKFTKYIYTNVGRAGLSLSFDPSDPDSYDIDPLSSQYITSNPPCSSVDGINMPFDAIDGETLKSRTITTSMRNGKRVAVFEYTPETYVKEMRAIAVGDIEAEVTHDLVIGCFAKGYTGYEVFIKTKQVWSEYEILPFGAYAKAALGGLLDNLNEDQVSYNGLLDVVMDSCSWGPRGKVQSVGQTVKIRGPLYASHYTNAPEGTTIYGPITNNYDWSYPVTVPSKGELKIDPLAEVGGTINGIYGQAKTFDFPEGGGISPASVPGNTFCAPFLSKYLTFPAGNNSDGLTINLDINKTNGADCF